MDDNRINTRTAKKAIGIETTLCANGAINIRSDLGSGRIHTVFVDPAGSVERCTCPGFTGHGTCYHSDYVEANSQLRSAARACTERQTVATDGGSRIEYTADCADCMFNPTAYESGPAHDAKDRHEDDCEGHNVTVRVDEGKDIHLEII